MEVHIYSSIKAIVATDIVKDIVTTQKGQSQKKISYGYLKFTHFAKKINREPRAQERLLLGYVSIYENTPKKLPHLPPKSCNNFTWSFKKGYNWSIAKVT